MAASSEKMKGMEAELHGQKVLNQHLLSKLHEKDDESRVLRKGITISDGRNRDMQLQLQDLNAEHQRARAELSHAQGENGQLQHVLYNARNYILQLEQQLRSLQQQQAGGGRQQDINNGNNGGGGGGYEDGSDGFMPPPPPDVF
jgi:chromosome segregation ATPase